MSEKRDRLRCCGSNALKGEAKAKAKANGIACAPRRPFIKALAPMFAKAGSNRSQYLSPTVEAANDDLSTALHNNSQSARLTKERLKPSTKAC